MYYIGLDVHKSVTAICILDRNGKVVKETAVRSRWTVAVGKLTQMPAPWAVCYEASCGYGALYDVLRRYAKRVAVAHPGHLRLIFKSKRKNDRVDAKKLATLLFLDQVPEVHVPNQYMRGWRSLIEFRHRTVAKRTRVKNALRALLRGVGIASPTGKGLWTRRGLAWLRALEFTTEEAALQRDLLLDELSCLERQVKRAERRLKILADRDPRVILLRTIPGVGIRTAEAAVAYIDDPRRFSRNRQIGAYFGLVPCQDSSADFNRLGHITREGPATMRKLLVEAAWQGIRRSERIRKHFERVMRGDGKRKKIALVATAHYLARVMLSMLSSGESWREESKAAKAA